MNWLSSNERFIELLDKDSYERKIYLVKRLLDGADYYEISKEVGIAEQFLRKNSVDVMDVVQHMAIREGASPLFTPENTEHFFYTVRNRRDYLFKDGVLDMIYLAPLSFLQAIREHKELILPYLDKALAICHKHNLARQKMKASHQRALNRPDHLKASPERNATIFKRYLEGESLSKIGASYEMTGSATTAIVKKLLRRINSWMTRKKHDDPNYSHPFTKEKYPQLYIDVREGEYLSLMYIPMQDLRLEKEFLNRWIDIVTDKIIQAEELRKKANPKK